MNKQIEEIAELTKELIKTNSYGTLNHVANHLYNAGYRKSTDVVAEVLEILSELKENYRADDDVREACAISYAEIKIVALKKKYESEGAE